MITISYETAFGPTPLFEVSTSYGKEIQVRTGKGLKRDIMNEVFNEVCSMPREVTLTPEEQIRIADIKRWAAKSRHSKLIVGPGPVVR